MGFRHISRALTCALLLGLAVQAPAAQTVPPNDLRQLGHAKTVRAERTERFLTAWEAASEARRREAADYLQVEAVGGALGGRPALIPLGVATRILTARDTTGLATDTLLRLAVSLDMQVLSGGFQPQSEGRGEALTVGVYGLVGPNERGPVDEPSVELSLYWESAPGTGEAQRIRARTEPFDVTNFARPGVPVYLRAPLSAEGLWFLVPELTAGGRTFRGEPIPVPCRVPAMVLSPTFAAYGLRAPDPVEGASPLALSRGGYAITHSGEAQQHLIFLVPAGESPAALFTGRTGEGWKAFAEERRATLWSCAVTLGDRRGFSELLRLARDASPDARLTVVGRADTAWILHSLFSQATPTPDGLVLVCPLDSIGSSLPAVPVLFIGPVASGEDATTAELITAQPGAALPILEERGLPQRLGAWLDS